MALNNTALLINRDVDPGTETVRSQAGTGVARCVVRPQRTDRPTGVGARSCRPGIVRVRPRDEIAADVVIRTIKSLPDTKIDERELVAELFWTGVEIIPKLIETRYSDVRPNVRIRRRTFLVLATKSTENVINTEGSFVRPVE